MGTVPVAVSITTESSDHYLHLFHVSSVEHFIEECKSGLTMSSIMFAVMMLSLTSLDSIKNCRPHCKPRLNLAGRIKWHYQFSI